MPKIKKHVEDKGKPVRKTKKKQKGGPKRPKSAYIYFCDANRGRLRDARPDMSATDIMVWLGKEWRKLDDSDKKEFATLAKKDRERYEKEKGNYVPPKESEVPPKPKRKKSAYIVFCQDKRNEVRDSNPQWGPREVTSELGRLWRCLSKEEQGRYKLVEV